MKRFCAATFLVHVLQIISLYSRDTLGTSTSTVDQAVVRMANAAFKGGLQSEELKKIVNRCSENKNQLGVILNAEVDDYLINEPKLCLGEPFLITAIHSNAPNFHRRSTIRNTWGSLRQIGKYRLKFVFILGNPGIPQMMQQIRHESADYRDIVLRDYQESYRNMTKKHITALRWISEHCSNAKFAMKVDDDTFVDVFHAVRFLVYNPPVGFYCTKTVGAKPFRKSVGPLSKWRVTRTEFRPKNYPPYCEGLGYMMPTNVAKQIFWCSLYSKFFWIDDVYIGGILPQKLQINLQKFWVGHGYEWLLPSHASTKILDNIFLMASHNEFMSGLWRNLWRATIQHSMELT